MRQAVTHKLPVKTSEGELKMNECKKGNGPSESALQIAYLYIVDNILPNMLADPKILEVVEALGNGN